jgi:hypothetical protein
VFLYSPVETFNILQNAASRLVAVQSRRGMLSQLNFEKLRRESEGYEPSSDENFLPVTGTKLDGVWRGRFHSGSAYTV